MPTTIHKTRVHPYIVSVPDVCGGRAVIEGTRIPVWSIVKWYKLGMNIEEIFNEFPHLSPAQIYDAFSYYYDHQKEIEEDIKENENEIHWKKFIKERKR